MKFKFSGTLLRFVDFNREVEVPAATLGQAIQGLLERHPTLAPLLYDADGRPRKAHRLFLNGDMLAEIVTTQPVTDQDTLEVLTAIAGG